ncbi:MAG: peptidoglycan DD-metalloendopeptidase family protein [Eubacteriales bacterium]|nr:peptidoglycan DD-metalloendopeptidase family protein [Eubacteriales bacterium]
MRYLSILFSGLLSSLLYGLIRLVLLLDRLIGLLYDLPLWPALGRALHRVGQCRAACAAAVFIPLLLVPGALLTRAGTLVLADGRPIGLVDDPAMLPAAVAALEQSAASLSGVAYDLPVQLETRPLRAPTAQFLSAAALREALIDASGELATLAVISVDGSRVGACRTAADAQALLDRVKAQYTTAADTDADFLQHVRVDPVVAQRSLVSDWGALYRYLAPRLDVTATRAVTYTETIPYQTITQPNDQRDQTHRVTLRKGSAGQALVTAQIETVDGEEHGRTIVARAVLRDATDEIIEVGTRNVGIGSGSFAAPLRQYTLASAFKWRWGRLHGGVDLAVDEGTPVYAADDGRVVVSEAQDGGYGQYLILDHQNGFKTLYGHNSALLVSVGDVVTKGERIALSGDTGNSTGPHLHFEIRVNDETVDPQRYVALA